MRQLDASPTRWREDARGFGDSFDRTPRSETPRIVESRRRAPNGGLDVFRRGDARDQTITRAEYHRRRAAA